MVGILLIAAAPRVWTAITNQGIFWPDEIFQSLEPAHKMAFGYGFTAWEFQEGARSWLFPGALGSLWKVMALAGIDDPRVLVLAAKLSMVAVALGGIFSALLIAERLGGLSAALLCGALAVAFPPSVIFSGRCMSEMVSATLLTLAILLSLESSRRRAIWTGVATATAVYVRYQSGLVAIALLIWLLFAKRRRDAFSYLLGALPVVVCGSILDAITWGSPFHSLWVYLRFNLIEGGAASFGVEPFTYYFTVLASAVGIAIVPIAIGLVSAIRQAPALVAIAVGYVVVHSMIDHKELRFILPIVPLALALSAAGLAQLLRSPLNQPKGATKLSPQPSASRETSAVLAVGGLLAALMAWRTAHASFDDLGQHTGPLSGSKSVWSGMDSFNRLLWAANRRPELCGLGLIGPGQIWLGGYSYLHRDVPMIWEPPLDVITRPGLGELGAASNYVLALASAPLPREYRTIETIGDAKLARREGGCSSPPSSYTRLFTR